MNKYNDICIEKDYFYSTLSNIHNIVVQSDNKLKNGIIECLGKDYLEIG